MPATLSPENRIATGLRALDCSGRDFVKLARSRGASISDAGLSRAMNDSKPFDRETGDKLLEILEQMRSLQSEVGVPINWASTQRISTVLTTRLVAEIDREAAVENSELQQMAIRATKSFEQQ